MKLFLRLHHHQLLHRLQAVETACGRTRTITWGPRVSPGVGLGIEPISFASDGIGVRESWDYAGAAVNLQRAWLHINVWLYEGKAPANGQPIDVEIGSIRFY